jgi:YD repeat-containing protein
MCVRAGARIDVVMGWDTQSCSDGSCLVYPDAFQGFPLSGTGVFGNPFSYTATFDDGTKRAFDYDLWGRVTRTSAHGTLHVTTADTDATGAPGMTCDSGTIAWKAVTG